MKRYLIIYLCEGIEFAEQQLNEYAEKGYRLVQIYGDETAESQSPRAVLELVTQ